MPIPRPQLIDQNYTRMDMRHSWFLARTKPTENLLSAVVSVCYQMKCYSTFRPALNSARKKCPQLSSMAENGKLSYFERIQVSHHSRYEAMDNTKHVRYSLTK